MARPQREHVELPITGMTCASCANRIERKLNKLDGVTATVNYATEKATVDFDAAAVAPEQLVAAVEAAGYQADAALRRPLRPTQRRASRRDCAAATPAASSRALLALPVLLLSMVPALQFDNWQWLVAAAGDAGGRCGARWPFHRAAWANLRHATATMDTLICVGTLAAWLWSLYALFLGDAGMTGMTMSFDLIPEPGEGGDEIYLEVAAVGDRVHARRPLLRGARQAPRRRCARGAARAGRQGRRRARRRRHRAARADRAARRRRPLRRAARREGRHRRRRRGGHSARRPVAADRRVRAGREARRATRSPARRSTPAGGWSSARPGSAPTPRWRRSPGSSPTRRSGKAPVQRLADRISGVFVPIVIAPVARHPRLLARRRRGPGVRLHRRGGRADHRLPVRARAGHADGAARRHRPRSAARAAHQGPGDPRVHAARSTRSCSTRPAP